MPDRLLKNLPVSPESLAFRAVVDVLQTDPVLKRLGIRWQQFDNDPTDTSGPTLGQCPFIQLTPEPGESRWSEESQHRGDFSVAIGMMVAGTHADDLFNLWHAVRLALFPQDVARRTWVQAKMSPLAVNGELTMQPFQVQVLSDSERALMGAGRLSVKLLVNT